MGELPDERVSSAEQAAGSSPQVAPDTYRALFEQSADAILIIDGDTFVDCNQATVDMLRYGSKQELLRTHPSELSPPTQPDGRDSFDKANEMIAIAFERGSHRFEWDHKRADGEVFPVEVLLTAIPRGDRSILHVVWRDITERKRLEQQLRQTQKLEAIGMLAGGIAHDFNNLLVAILGNAELLALEAQGRPELQELVVEIRRAAERAADLTHQLLTFSREQVVQRRNIDLNAILLGLDKLLGRLIGEDVELVTRPWRSELVIHADPGQMEQVVVNLVTNARDAMPDGGTLTLATREVVLDQAGSTVAGVPAPGIYAELTVTDTGSGMSAEVAKRAFEPFFTTKDVGRGTGLGLSTVYGILKQSNGTVTLQSKLGRGTTVRVLLPVVPGAALVLEAARTPGPTAAGGAETILVVEDEPAVADLVARVLEQNGYRVLLATNGREALEQIEHHRQRIDLVFTDAVMPQMGGVELAAHLRELGAAPRVLMTSGYIDRSRTRVTYLDQAAELLKKPFTPQDLLRKVREVLDR